jgi:hypothetical protein
MLTPIDVHFLVGLLTLVSRPDGVELELGSMVLDTVADENRDVDITVRSLGEGGTVSIFEGIEVKHHKRPLDVTHIEQLCAKLRDMPDILAPGIVSSSGYTEPATRKATHNGVTLYSLCDWTAPMKLGGVMLSDELKFREQTYKWVTMPHIQFNPNLHLPDSIKKQIEPDTPVFDRNGIPLLHTPTYRALADNLASQTTALSEQQGQPLEMKVGEIRSVAFNITLEHEPYIVAGTTRITLSQARLTGELACVEKVITPMFKVLVRYEDQQPFVGCAVFEMSMGNLAGISVDPSRKVHFINVPIADRLLKKIYRRHFS